MIEPFGEQLRLLRQAYHRFLINIAQLAGPAAVGVRAAVGGAAARPAITIDALYNNFRPHFSLGMIQLEANVRGILIPHPTRELIATNFLIRIAERFESLRGNSLADLENSPTKKTRAGAAGRR